MKRAKGLKRRRGGTPRLVRLILVVALVVLGGFVVTTAAGGIGTLVGALQASMSGFVGKLTTTPEPSATHFIVSDAPLIAPPFEPYTGQPTVDLLVTVPSIALGNSGARLRVYLTLEGQAPAPIAELPMGGTIRMVVPVELTPGRNDFHATILESGVESDQSPIVTFILDTEAPTFVLASPVDTETVNADTVTIKGTTQARTAILVRNGTNGTSISGQAGSDGLFSMDLPLEAGPNAITISGIDPAGNRGELALSVMRGDGTLTATLTASAYRIATTSLPVSIQLGVRVLNPDGQALPDAAVTFTLTVPGIPPVAKDGVTDADGRATFTTTLPAGVTVGTGLATVLVGTIDFGSTSAQKTITIIP